ncbi:MAG: sulfatase-like hydrolase/transferase [Candidatus Schmidhempelia sp.]|nr:sulfatase-like hydrolase/transferase [Candidatus Schmidhempelia sp.]
MFFLSIPTTVLLILSVVIATPMLASLIKKYRYQLVVIILLSLFIVTELISIYFSGGFIDYQFFVNLNFRDIFAGLFIFKLQAVLAIFSFILFVFGLTFMTKWAKQYIVIWLRLIVLLFTLILIGQNGGPLSKIYEIYQITVASQQPFDQALTQLGMVNYVKKPQLVTDKGKNIIVISLESFERGFMDMPDITPNLTRLSQQYTYFPSLPMGIGSSWTTASMYTYMTGVPFLIGELTTMPMKETKALQLVSLGDVLHQAGYQTKYIMGNPNFAGMGHIISLFGIPVISEANYPNQYPPAPFGLYDRDIFDVAKREITEFTQSKQPFALFISTVSTHAPNGFEDKRMHQYISPKSNNMAFVAASLDYNLGEFIHYLERNHLLEDTVFYIFPDHLMMGIGTETITKLSLQTRSLYLISNADTKTLNHEESDTLYQIDLPRIILNGAQINSNAKFLTDYLSRDGNKLEFIKSNKEKIAQLNKAAEIGSYSMQ